MVKTNYKIQGTPNSPVLIFSNSLGSNLSMWDELVPSLLPYFRVLQYDTRGHGESDLSSGDYSIGLLGQDVIDLLDSLGIDQVYFCGLSMGGLIGQWLGIYHPDRIVKLIISNTDSKIGTLEGWNERIKTIKKGGLATIVESTLDKWFTPRFRKINANTVQSTKKMFLANKAEGYIGCCAAVRDADFGKELNKIGIETLIITGDQDAVTTAEQAGKMQEQIPNSVLKVLPARHLASTELPQEYAEILIDFIVGSDSFTRGMHVRRTVLGDSHVDRANKNKNAFNTDFQEFISNYAWGEIWTRPGLSKPNRSLITLAMLIALNRKPEFKMHLKAALNNGLQPEQIKEVILQAGIYCGLPAANEALHVAQEVFEETGTKYQ